MEPLNLLAYRFADVEVHPRQGRLTRAGQEVHLRPKSFQLLVYLIEHREQLVTKGELLDSLWCDTAVTEGVLVQCIIDIRKALGDPSRRPKYIRNVPRVGYRFIHPVEAFAESVAPSCPGARPSLFSLSRRRFSSPKAALLAGLAVILVAVAVTAIYVTREWHGSGPASDPDALPGLSGKKPVAVMFFDNRSNSPELAWLREGLADMIITNLSRNEHLAVLSRQQLHRSVRQSRWEEKDAFPLEDLLHVARHSKVDLVVSGSFAQLGEQILIDARIYDSRSGELVSAENLLVDKPEEILQQVDSLTFKLTQQLDPAGVPQSALKGLSAMMTDSLEAYRYYSLAVERAQAYHSLEAMELLQRAIALDPEFAMAYARIGYAYAAIHNNESDLAKPYLEKAFRLSHRLAEIDRLWIVTWYALAHDDIDGAVRSLRQLIVRYPLEVEAYWKLGQLLQAVNRSGEALSVYRQGLAIDPEARDIWNSLGLAYCYGGQYGDAIAALKRYVEVASDESNAYDSLGMCYTESGRFSEALIEFGRALQINPKFNLAMIHMGDAYAHLGRYGQAMEQYRRALEIAPTNWDRAFTHNRLAMLRWRHGDLQQAEVEANKELQLNNDLGGSLLIALARGDIETAAELKEPFLAGSPEFRPLSGSARWRSYFLGYFALKTARHNEAIEHFKELTSGSGTVWNDRWPDCLAKAYLEMGRWDEAITEYRRLVALNPNYALLHFYLGQAYQGQGRRELAQASYRRFLEIWREADPDIPEVMMARQELEISDEDRQKDH